jgi:CheY-like chemotaxis protein/tRNA A-37 threonylcarbamoyl transferase component Bud32
MTKPLSSQVKTNKLKETQVIDLTDTATFTLAQTHSPPTVLVVDDDVIIHKVVRSLLEKDGIKVVEALNVADALEVITTRGLWEFDCVITDYMMPDETGLDLTRRIKQYEENISVILLTARDEKELVKESLRAGIFDFVEKPLAPDRFITVVQAAIQQTAKYRKDRKQRYFIEGKIGEGGLGQVHRAWDNDLRRHVALKRLHKKENLSSQDPAKLFGEAIRLARLQHPNIVNIFDYGLDSNGAFIVMELLKGRTLDEAVHSSPPWPLEKLRNLANQCLDALIAAHDLNLIHLDIKPPNIMLLDLPSGSFHAKILDFGLSQQFTTLLKTDHNNETVFGSPLYVAPEVYQGETLDCRTDLYALGCSIFLAATGKDAFFADSIQHVRKRHLNHDVANLQELRPDLKKSFCEWVMSLIEANRTSRPPTAFQAKADLSGI